MLIIVFTLRLPRLRFIATLPRHATLIIIYDAVTDLPTLLFRCFSKPLFRHTAFFHMLYAMSPRHAAFYAATRHMLIHMLFMPPCCLILCRYATFASAVDYWLMSLRRCRAC